MKAPNLKIESFRNQIDMQRLNIQFVLVEIVFLR